MGSQPRPGEDSHRMMATRSYVWPEAATAGSRMTSYVIGHRNADGAFSDTPAPAGMAIGGGQCVFGRLCDEGSAALEEKDNTTGAVDICRQTLNDGERGQPTIYATKLRYASWQRAVLQQQKLKLAQRTGCRSVLEGALRGSDEWLQARQYKCWTTVPTHGAYNANARRAMRSTHANGAERGFRIIRELCLKACLPRGGNAPSSPRW